MLEKIKRYFPHVIFVETIMIVMLSWIAWGMFKANMQSLVMPSNDSTISRVTVTSHVPMKGLNKQEAHKAGIITDDIAKAHEKAVLATGKVVDDSGSRNVSAVLNTNDGSTEMVEKRSFMETMKRFEVGIGYGYESGNQAKAVQVRATIGRLDRFYFTGQSELFEVERIENQHPWNAMAFVNIRF